MQGGAAAPTTTTTGRERPGKKSRETEAPPDLEVRPEHTALASELGLAPDRARTEVPRFLAYNRARGVTAVDWNALFLVWLRNVPEDDARRGASGTNGHAEIDERPDLPASVRAH